MAAYDGVETEEILLHLADMAMCEEKRAARALASASSELRVDARGFRS